MQRDNASLSRQEEPQVPKYTIDLSMVSIERYQHLATDLLPQFASILAFSTKLYPDQLFKPQQSYSFGVCIAKSGTTSFVAYTSLPVCISWLPSTSC